MELQHVTTFRRVRKDANFNAFPHRLEYNNIAYYIYFVAFTGNVKLSLSCRPLHFLLKAIEKLIKVNSTSEYAINKIDFSQTHFSGSIPMKILAPIWQQQAFLNGLWN